MTPKEIKWMGIKMEKWQKSEENNTEKLKGQLYLYTKAFDWKSFLCSPTSSSKQKQNKKPQPNK